MRTYTSYYGNSTASPAYSDGMITRVVNNNLTDNLNWAMDEINQSIRYLVTKYYFNERSYSTVTASGTQFYNLPPQVKKLINITVLIGSTLWQPKECPSREYWDYLNTISFNQDYPSFFFVYDGQVGLWPTPASSSNAITMHYKTRIADLSMADVTSTTASTTVSVTTNTTTVTIGPEELRAKRNAILKHSSQMESAPFLGNDERLFWQRAEDRNRATAKLYDDLGMACYEAMEAFVEYKLL